MAIVHTADAEFTGASANVEFVKGVAECDSPAALAFFRSHPDVFTVEDAEPVELIEDPTAEAERLEVEKAEADRIESERIAAETAEAERLASLNAAPSKWDDLTDEELADAYALNVAGNATSRNGKLKALHALED